MSDILTDSEILAMENVSLEQLLADASMLPADSLHPPTSSLSLSAMSEASNGSGSSPFDGSRPASRARLDRRGPLAALKVGAKVQITEGSFKGKTGIIAFTGAVKFAAGGSGSWVGVIL